MSHFKRKITPSLHAILQRGKSILLLGPRQTGKTTLILEEVKPDMTYSLIQPDIRQRYEQNPSLIGSEIKAEIRLRNLTQPIVAIDEVQKVPQILDVAQDLIDNKVAQFLLTGSSARKLKYGPSINLLPGRIVLMQLDPLILSEMGEATPALEELLAYGALPGVVTVSASADKNKDLDSYARTYLEEEIRAEAAVRNVDHFAKFLRLASSESGRLINLSKLSQAVGVAHTTISSYFQILEDCLIVERIEPLTQSQKRNRLSKAPKFLFFDLGLRRLCAQEGVPLPLPMLGHLFEQFVGLELIRNCRWLQNPAHIRYWRDHAGPEIDYVIEYNQTYIPIEVKWSEQPTEKDCRHLKIFLDEYDNASQGYVICRTTKPFLISDNIMAMPWQEMDRIVALHCP